MTIEEMIRKLSRLPQDMTLYVDNDREQYSEIDIEPVTESCDDPTVIAYVITQKRQLDFDFMKDVNEL